MASAYTILNITPLPNTVTTASIGIDITASPNNNIDNNTVLENIVGVIYIIHTDNVIRQEQCLRRILGA